MEPKIKENENQVWDLRKIIVFLFVLGLILFGFKTFVLDTKNSTDSKVEGISVRETPLPSIFPNKEIKQGLDEKISDLKKEVNNINIAEIATSTPAVKKVLNDFKNLQNLPQSQAKEACIKICNSL